MYRHFSAFPCDEASVQRHQANLREQERRDASLDEALRCTFPASDPVALNFSPLLAPVREQLRLTIDFFKHARPRSSP